MKAFNKELLEQFKREINDAEDTELLTLMVNTIKNHYSFTRLFAKIFTNDALSNARKAKDTIEITKKELLSTVEELKEELAQAKHELALVETVLDISEHKEKAMTLYEGAKQIEERHNILVKIAEEKDALITKLQNEILEIKRNSIIPERSKETKNYRLDVNQEVIEEMYISGVDIKDIAFKFGMKYSGIRRRLVEEGNKVYKAKEKAGRPVK